MSELNWREETIEEAYDKLRAERDELVEALKFYVDEWERNIGNIHRLIESEDKTYRLFTALLSKIDGEPPECPICGNATINSGECTGCGYSKIDREETP